MRLLADENVPGQVIDALRQAGYDVSWVGDLTPGATDEAVLSQAQSEGRVVLTFDKDFGELAFRFGLPATSGVVLVRVALPGANYAARLAVAALNSRTDWQGHFAVVEETRIRMTRLRTR